MHGYKIEGDVGGFKASLDVQQERPGVELVTLRLTAPAAAPPPEVTLMWREPSVGIVGCFHPAATYRWGLTAAGFSSSLTSHATADAPVMSFFAADGTSRCTFAVSDALNAVRLRGGIVQETSQIAMSLTFLAGGHPPLDKYEATVRIDRRPVPYESALDEMRRWWEPQPRLAPCHVPRHARLPMYSTWYAFHQEMDAATLLAECRRAKPLGMDAIIIDDGWQTTDARRGYAYTGDWQPDRLPEMAQLVDGIHKLGMKVMLWYAVPFVGYQSRNYDRFKGRYLADAPGMGAGVLDPRHPDVRHFLIDTYTAAQRQWKLDGFKLDFVSRFNDASAAGTPATDATDTTSVALATDRLMKDLLAELRRADPDVLVEFRQPYTGPLMRTYGNMLRANDCPNDPLTQRVRTASVRLLAGETAVHQDMVMWHRDEPPEAVARHLLAGFFAVPQISMRLDKLPAAHTAVLRHHLALWRELADVLLSTDFHAAMPQSNFPLIWAQHDGRRVAAAYEPVSIDLTAAPQDVVLLNATAQPRLIVDADRPHRWRTFDCTGAAVGEVETDAGLAALPVPPGGSARTQA